MPLLITIPEFAASVGLISPPGFNENLLIETILNGTENIIFNWLGVKLTSGVVTELLPVGMSAPQSLGALDVVRTRYRVMLEDQRGPVTSVLRLTKPPVLLADVQIWVDVDAAGGQADIAFAAETELTAGTDFFLDVEEPEAEIPLSRTGFVYRIVGSWPVNPRCVKARYTSGATAEWIAENAPELKLAAWEMAGIAYRRFQILRSGQAPKIAEKIGDYSYQSDTKVVASLLGGAGSAIPGHLQSTLSPLRRYGAFIGG